MRRRHRLKVGNRELERGAGVRSDPVGLIIFLLLISLAYFLTPVLLIGEKNALSSKQKELLFERLQFELAEAPARTHLNYIFYPLWADRAIVAGL